MLRKCKICGDKFESISSNHRYCDRCRFEKCAFCGKKVLIKPMAKNKPKHHFCSRECFSLWSRGKKQSKELVKKRAKAIRGRKTGKFVECENCGKRVYKYPRDLKRAEHYFCCKRCAYVYRKGCHLSPETEFKVGQMAGEKHYNWKDGISPKINIRCGHKWWKELRLEIYERDNWTCQECSKKCHNDIQCHHIIPESMGGSHQPDNLITLCKSCHMKIERKLREHKTNLI